MLLGLASPHIVAYVEPLVKHILRTKQETQARVEFGSLGSKSMNILTYASCSRRDRQVVDASVIVLD